ncbi:MAG: phosphoglucomutase/phosphomannomutase family protein, partial [Candidatus Omnitrophica bacterium]|nr:phosphoglucomutase/phosphomannomutase family protein [Candidatus Omnitrophota bacterium]
VVTQAIADYIRIKASRPSGNGVVIGYDNRFMGERFAETAAGVLAGNGITVYLSKASTSTPALSLAIKQNKFTGGIMVTASHNPPQYNGIKYKADYAGPADPEIIKAIENFLGRGPIKSISLEDARKAGLLKDLDLNKPHLKFLEGYLDMKLLKKMKAACLVDVMYGSGNHLIETLLKGTSLRIKTIHSELNPGFAGVPPEPIEKNLKDLIAMMKSGKYDIGLATDGDADRIGAITAGGRYISSSQIIGLLLVHFIEDKKWTGAVVKTISGSFLIDEIAKAYGLKLYETPVGFKYICDLMIKKDILIGGEESGGIGFKDYVPERDGSLAGLLLLEMMGCRKKPIGRILDEIEKRFGKFCQYRIDMEYPDKKKAALFSRLKDKPPAQLLGKKIVETKTYDGIKFISEDKSWLLFRASGTEPILRIYCEARSEAGGKKLAELGRSLAS